MLSLISIPDLPHLVSGLLKRYPARIISKYLYQLDLLMASAFLAKRQMLSTR
jgi:hypothetical protein